MTTNRRDVQQALVLLDDLAAAMGVPFATDTKRAFEIIDMIEAAFAARDREAAGMMRGDIRFRCRLCSLEFVGANVERLGDALDALLTIGVLPEKPEIRRMIRHRCEDGRVGIAELVGAEVTSAPPPDRDEGEPFHPDHKTARG